MAAILEFVAHLVVNPADPDWFDNHPVAGTIGFLLILAIVSYGIWRYVGNPRD